LIGSNPDWSFSQRSFSDVDQEVTEADLFNTEEVAIAEALVREAAQNSQDAVGKAGGPVRLRIDYVDAGELDVAFLRDLTAPLLGRLKACDIDVANYLAHPAVLVVEDFGTSGLTGDTDNDTDRGNYRSFWFRHGGSFKRGEKGGRWGLGKLVFPISSRLRCFFGLTIREGEDSPLLLGQAVLRTHQLGNKKFAPHGHFGVHAEDKIAPVIDAAFAARFRKAFKLKRQGEPGLSVVVPYPVEKPDQDEITRFVVQNYAFPILTGRLEVEVLGQLITEHTVRDLGKNVLQPGLVEFIEDVHTTPDVNLFKLSSIPFESGGFYIKEDLFETNDLEDLRTRYGNGELVGLRLPIQVTKRDEGTPSASYVDVFLKSAGDGEEGSALCVRGDITIPGEAKRFASKEHFALLKAGHKVVSEFLGDAENAAHTSWSDRAARFDGRWKNYAPQTLRLIRQAPIMLHRLLATGKEQSDPNALINFFWVEDRSKSGDNDAARPKRKAPTTVITTPIPPDLPKAKRRINIHRVAGGFSITPGADFGELSLPSTLRVEVAYDVERGNALKDWEPFDFDLSEGSGNPVIEADGAEYEAHGNRVELDIQSAEFRLCVSGFDQQRDLVVQTAWLKNVTTNA
jgi:hypothetical protein